jgi:hypothetical protein
MTGDQCLRLMTSLASMSLLSRKCEILNILQTYRLPWPVTRIVYLIFMLFTYSSVYGKGKAIPVTGHGDP